jgi:hypothetical protein
MRRQRMRTLPARMRITATGRVIPKVTSGTRGPCQRSSRNKEYPAPACPDVDDDNVGRMRNSRAGCSRQCLLLRATFHRAQTVPNSSSQESYVTTVGRRLPTLDLIELSTSTCRAASSSWCSPLSFRNTLKFHSRNGQTLFARGFPLQFYTSWIRGNGPCVLLLEILTCRT